MAYARSGRRSGGRAGGYSRSSRSGSRGSRGGYTRGAGRTRRASTGRRRTTTSRGGVQTVRIVMEAAPASAVSRPNPFARMFGAPEVATRKPRKAPL